jgi:hypothetical protein
MTNIISSLIILCNYGNGKYKLLMYCLYIILHAGIIGLIIFSKPRLEPRLWAFSCYKPSPSPIQAHRWAGLGLKQAGLGWALGPGHHYPNGGAEEHARWRVEDKNVSHKQ